MYRRFFFLLAGSQLWCACHGGDVLRSPRGADWGADRRTVKGCAGSIWSLEIYIIPSVELEGSNSTLSLLSKMWANAGLKARVLSQAKGISITHMVQLYICETFCNTPDFVWIKFWINCCSDKFVVFQHFFNGVLMHQNFRRITLPLMKTKRKAKKHGVAFGVAPQHLAHTMHFIFVPPNSTSSVVHCIIKFHLFMKFSKHWLTLYNHKHCCFPPFFLKKVHSLALHIVSRSSRS